MNISELKKYIKIPDFLRAYGHEPTSQKGGYLHYKSPLREDNKPSFWVNVEKDICGDFASGTIGDIISLAKLYYQSDERTALANIADCFRLGFFSFAEHPRQSQPPTKPSAAINIKHTQPLQNKALIQYAEGRGISAPTAQKFLMECYYSASESAQAKQYFAIAFQNDKGGFELRNKYFKGGTSPKGITTIKQASDTAVIFEGFMDFLSAEEFWHVKTGGYIPYNVIVLNSIVNRPYIDLKPYRFIKCFLDNDGGGVECFQKIAVDYPQAQNLSQKLFPDNKDFNDFWVSHKKNCK